MFIFGKSMKPGISAPKIFEQLSRTIGSQSEKVWARRDSFDSRVENLPSVETWQQDGCRRAVQLN
jgi:hypothetical protein